MAGRIKDNVIKQLIYDVNYEVVRSIPLTGTLQAPLCDAVEAVLAKIGLSTVPCEAIYDANAQNELEAVLGPAPLPKNTSRTSVKQMPMP